MLLTEIGSKRFFLVQIICMNNLSLRYDLYVSKKIEVMTYVFLARGLLCNALDDDLVVVHFQGTYIHHKEIKAAMGIKITAQVFFCPY